jgi:glycosyltransferase involved in cell wall biosynthesis
MQVLRAAVAKFDDGFSDGGVGFVSELWTHAAVITDRSARVRQAGPKVAILMCTYHGQKYLAEQLDSFAAQTHGNWELWVSDDGSKDDTHTILNAYVEKWGAHHKLSLHRGPAKGFVANFLSLTCKAGVEADYYAYSDQDDIWEADKLQRAVSFLQSVPKATPAIYCSRTRIVNFKNEDIGLSPLFKKPPSFAHALMQNIGGGNTMVFNNAARQLLRLAGDDVQVITHDWWVYLAVVACGGVVRYDPCPTLRYRQHSDNLVGSNVDLVARFVRIRMLWQGRFKALNDQHLCALERIRPYMTYQNKATLDEFRAARSKRLLPRLAGLWRTGIHRQTPLGNLGVWVAAIFKKL